MAKKVANYFLIFFIFSNNFYSDKKNPHSLDPYKSKPWEFLHLFSNIRIISSTSSTASSGEKKHVSSMLDT